MGWGTFAKACNPAQLDLLETEKRPVNAVADNNEVKSVKAVTVREDPDSRVAILFDQNHSWDERILTESLDISWL